MGRASLRAWQGWDRSRQRSTAFFRGGVVLEVSGDLRPYPTRRAVLLAGVRESFGAAGMPVYCLAVSPDRSLAPPR
ncbi:hypothetical protein GCM10018791_49250 [Streptomyces zaomyceticus]|nr:hypothetical protein GCM10018791_49250 [Streptomyces zaomyceticus]